MSIRRKILHSVLVGGMLLGNLNGVIVQGISTIGTRSNDQTIKNKTESNQIKKESNLKNIKENQNSQQNLSEGIEQAEKNTQKSTDTKKNESNNKTTKNADDYKDIIEQGVKDRFGYLYSESMKNFNHNFRIGEVIQVEGPYRVWNFQTEEPGLGIPGDYLFNKLIYLIGFDKLNTVDSSEGVTKSGNWHVLFKLRDNYNNPMDNTVDITMTRLANNPVGDDEVIENIRLDYIYSLGTGYKLYKMDGNISFLSADKAIGDIKVTIKNGQHNLDEGQDVTNLKLLDYLDVSNARGTVSASWAEKPDTSKVGEQKGKVKVTDSVTSRETIVDVPFNVKPGPLRMTAKSGNFEIYQYDRLPDPKDYFDVPNANGTYSIEWLSNVNTNVSGVQNWQAKATAEDGRTAEASVPINVKPHEGLKVQLKPIEDRVMGNEYPSFASNFKDYIDSVTMHGVPVAVDDLEFVEAESSEPNFTYTGTQPVKLTVQTRHTNSGVMIKGTGETTINVLWGHTIYMRSATGASAGSFSLKTDNSGNPIAKIVFGTGIPSAMNVAVGPLSSPFSLYYSFEVLRGDTVVYSQDVSNRATLQQIMDQFGNTSSTIDVRYDDVIKIYHPERTPNSSVVMIDEKEEDYTYDSEYAYYKITPYGFDPFPVLDAESSQKSFVLGENTSMIEPASLLKNVTINGRTIDSKDYTVEALVDFDTHTIGARKMNLNVTTNDGLATKEFEVDYQVKWGSTFVLKGLNDATVGAFSLLKENDQWALHASQGVSGTDLSQPVNNHFGRDIYYGIEVIENITTKYQYNVLGNQSIREGIEGFNQGKPLNVKQGDVIKVYHAEPTGNSLLMQDELAKDFTMGSNDAYYEVTEHGLEPILAISTDTKPQEFSLGDDATEIDGTQLINYVTINGTELTPDLYTVKQLGNFDTTTVGQKELAIQFDTKDGVVSKVITVPYEVKWGRTIVMKSSTGGSAGVFSLQTTNTTRQLKIHHGFDSPLDERLGNDQDLYYSIEVLRGERVQYSQEVPGRVTLQDVINSFGSNGTQAVTVQLDDVIKIYHPQKSPGSSVLMVDELEEDFTYGSDFAYYKVTTYGFEAMPVMEVHTANKAFYLAQDVTTAADAELIDRVTINGKTVDPEEYTIERRSEIDTTTIGNKNVAMRVKMNDGLSSVQLELPYQVKWGSTFVLKGEEKEGKRGIVGSFSLLDQNDQLAIYATKGEDETELNAPVNSAYGRNAYYRIDILADPKNKANSLFPDNIKYTYEVAGNQTVRQAIEGFNNGESLPVEEGDIFRVYHAETDNQNLLMWDDIVKNYTAGLNYAYYEVKNGEFEPITMIHADVASQELVLGEDTSEVDVTTLIENVAFNGQSLNTELYKVEQTGAFDTHTTGEKTVTVKVSTADGVSSTDIEVPYEVKWGSTIHLKNRKGETVGSFGLLKNSKQIEIQSVQGTDQTVLKNRVNEYDDTEVYYGIEILNERKQSKYQYEVRGTQTIEQAISRFNTGKSLAVTTGDIVKVYHVDTSNNLLMAEENERNYTYGSNYAYYKVTDYGFEPTGELTVEPAQPSFAQGTETVDLKSLVKEVKVNGRVIPKNVYTVSLDGTSEIDTETMGSRFVSLDVKVDRSYGSLSTRTESSYEIVEPGQETTPGEEDASVGGAEGTDTSNDPDAEGISAETGLGEASGADGNGSNLPQTNQTINRVLPYIGVCLLLAVGFVLWKRKTSKKSFDKQ
ncbi:cell wall protein [Enterococcus mundtii]|uniref:LPXTG cell wall anchor domain-containing protein n=1 Tax=Enterococcus mundtii TaxID=53346 RepID=UPI000D3A2AAA|nr:LPXTG cell wall anchor domain-containing protein [Enterococcus mundtii]PTO40271.1 cell wall protein [Enterococcus mundtii]PTO44893.1 cell wall protein [Enterococcus mundtii]